MGLFNDMLRAGESLFKNEDALDFEFVPPIIPFRENQQQYIATCIKPLLLGRNGKNVIVHGPPGIGKTVAIKHVFRELEEETEEVVPIYVNCWKANTTYKILVELCHELGYRFTQNKKTDDLLKVVESMCNKQGVVFAFDEADKCQDFDFLYFLLENIYKKTMILITNYKETFTNMDERIVSRLTPGFLEFKEYDSDEIRKILEHRIDFAFVPNCFSAEALDLISKKTSSMKDIRSGVYLLRESGLAAEDTSSKQITPDHANTAIEKLDEFSTKKKEDLNEDSQRILNLVKRVGKIRIGELFEKYRMEGGQSAYKTFQRRIEHLSANRFITTEKVSGAGGNTTLISAGIAKTLGDFN